MRQPVTIPYDDCLALVTAAGEAIGHIRGVAQADLSGAKVIRSNEVADKLAAATDRVINRANL